MLNNEQKKYTVLQIEKYKSDAEKFDKKAEKNRWFMYGSIALMTMALIMKGDPNISQWISGIGFFTGLSLSIENLKNMVANMTKKVGLENMATNLEYMMQNEEMSAEEDVQYKGRGL